MTNEVIRKCDETLEEYKIRLFENKSEYSLSWYDVTLLLNGAYGTNFSVSKYKREARKLGYCKKKEDTSMQDLLLEFRKERMKMSDERTQINAYVRQISREETIIEIAKQAAAAMNNKKQLCDTQIFSYQGENEGILLLSDWHYGIEVNNYWNRYNPDICKVRVERLRDIVLDKCRKNNVRRLHILNLADLICGRIHLSLRLESRIDVVTQIIEVSEILGELLCDFAKQVKVDYYDCLDNHSRLEPDKSASLDLESLARITAWYLKFRQLPESITIHDNKFDEGIIDLTCLGHKVLGAHGDRDKQNKAIENLSLMTRDSYDLICTAHMHHFSADERNETLLISNGSLMGTDTYAKNLRLTSKPSQTLIIATEENVADSIHRIILP